MSTPGRNEPRSLRSWLVVAAVGIAGAYTSAVGCSDEESAESLCVPGTTIACLGSGQCDGIQTCSGDGSGYGACDCGTTTTSTSTTTSGSGASGGTAGAGGATGGEGGAGGTGGAAGVGGSGGGIVASCTAEAGDDECVACMKQQCCPSYGPCFGSGDCRCYVGCQNESPGTCLFNCGLTEVPTSAVPLLQCSHQLCNLQCTPD